MRHGAHTFANGFAKGLANDFANEVKIMISIMNSYKIRKYIFKPVFILQLFYRCFSRARLKLDPFQFFVWTGFVGLFTFFLSRIRPVDTSVQKH